MGEPKKGQGNELYTHTGDLGEPCRNEKSGQVYNLLSTENLISSETIIPILK